MPTRDCIGKKLSLGIAVVGGGAVVGAATRSGEEDGLSSSCTLEADA